MNVMLLLLTGVVLAGLALATLLSLVARQKLRAMLLGGAALAWGTAYAAALLLVSLSSREIVLRPGQTKNFCGFYFDCHIGVAVVGDSVTHSLGSVAARNEFHVITLEFSSDALRAVLKPYDLRIALVGTDGARYQRAIAAEDALYGLAGHEPLARDIQPGGRYTAQVVFDLPEGAGPVRLSAHEGLGIDRVLERILIGDEDSFLHRPVLLALPAPGLASASR